MGVLPARRLQGEHPAHGLAIGRRRIGPIGLGLRPPVAEPFRVGVAILRDDRRDRVRPSQRQAKSHRRAIVEDVEGVAGDPDRVGKGFHGLGQAREAVLETLRRGREAKPREVWSDHMEAIGQTWDQMAKLVGRGRKAVQQQDRRMLPASGFAVEDRDVTDVGAPQGDLGRNEFRHLGSFLTCWSAGGGPERPPPGRSLDC